MGPLSSATSEMPMAPAWCLQRPDVMDLCGIIKDLQVEHTHTRIYIYHITYTIYHIPYNIIYIYMYHIYDLYTLIYTISKYLNTDVIIYGHLS